MSADIHVEPLDYYDPEWSYYWVLYEADTGERLNGGLGRNTEDCIIKAEWSYRFKNGLTMLCVTFDEVIEKVADAMKQAEEVCFADDEFWYSLARAALQEYNRIRVAEVITDDFWN